MPKDSEKKPNRVRVSVVEEEKNTSNDDKVKETTERLEEKDEEVKDNQDKPTNTDEKVFEERDESGPKSDKIPLWILILAFLIGLILGAGLIGGIFYYRSHLGNDISLPIRDKDKEETDIVYEETPSPTSEAKVDYTKYTVNILNGSGIKGEAAKVEELLLDFKFKSIDTDNADSYDFSDTEIAIKDGLPDSLYTDLEKALSSYSVKKVDNLESSSSFDIQITVGQNKSE